MRGYKGCIHDKMVELHPTRVKPTYTTFNNCLDEGNAMLEDHIHVYLLVDQWQSNNSVREKVSLGTITGLETSGEEGSCTVYDSNGTKTHTIMKHRTLLVYARALLSPELLFFFFPLPIDVYTEVSCL